MLIDFVSFDLGQLLPYSNFSVMFIHYDNIYIYPMMSKYTSININREQIFYAVYPLASCASYLIDVNESVSL